MTYTELNLMSGKWGFTLGSIAGDMMRNAKWGMTKKAFATAQVSDHDIETLMFWAKREGVDLTVALDIAFAGVIEVRGAQTSSDRELSAASGRAVTCEKCKRMEASNGTR
jgi:hypothetical protein